MKQNKVIYTKSGLSENVVQSYCEALNEGLEQIKSGKQSEDIAAPKNLIPAMANNFSAAMKQADSPWFRYFLQLDASKELSKISCPVLALNGKLDTQVDCEDNLGVLESQLRTKKKKIIAFDNLNHLFQNCKTGLVTEYGDIEETISQNVLDTISKWISEICKGNCVKQ